MHDNMFVRLWFFRVLLLEQRLCQCATKCNMKCDILESSRHCPNYSRYIQKYVPSTQENIQNIDSSEFFDSKISKPSLLFNPDDGWRLLAACNFLFHCLSSMYMMKSYIWTWWWGLAQSWNRQRPTTISLLPGRKKNSDLVGLGETVLEPRDQPWHFFF